MRRLRGSVSERGDCDLGGDGYAKRRRNRSFRSRPRNGQGHGDGQGHGQGQKRRRGIGRGLRVSFVRDKSTSSARSAVFFHGLSNVRDKDGERIRGAVWTEQGSVREQEKS